MPLLFALTMFVSATLLFLVQPMIGKFVLPLLGGTPAVWNTCMVFYQALLLLGYYYAHKSTSSLPAKKQTTVHAVVLLSALGVLLVAAMLTANNSPIPIVKSLSPQGDDYPFFGVIVLLTAAIGLPFFVVSTSAPLLQKWFAETGHPASKDPYFLYAASNFGSLLALIAYPAVVEKNLRLIHQAWVWAIGYGILVVMVMMCARVVRRGPMMVERPRKEQVPVVVDDPEPSPLRKLRWLGLAFVPSSLMLGVTTFVSTDMASIPLLWIIPLSLYLITFIIVFSKVPKGVHLSVTLLMPVAVLLLAFLMTSHVPAKFGLQVLLHMVTFFIVAMVCHGELAHDRPSTKHLTGFYLIMSVGGMLGGLFNALVAPIVFTFTSEYPITLVLACFLLPSMFVEKDKQTGNWTQILDILLPLGIFFICSQMQTNASSLSNYAHANGPLILIGLVAFTLPALAAVFLLEKDLRFRIVLGILLGSSLLLYAGAAPLLNLLGTNTDHIAWLRFAIVVIPVAAYAWDWNRFGRDERTAKCLAFGYVSLVASFGVMLAVTSMMDKDFIKDMIDNTKVSAATVRQILIYGVPAMLCYFFVERPHRFGLAVAALWLATFWVERKKESDVFYDRSFFGRLKIETSGQWEKIPIYMLPDDDILDNDAHYKTTIEESRDQQTITYHIAGEQVPIYLEERTMANGLIVRRDAFIRREYVQLVHGTTVHGLQESHKERLDIASALLVFNPSTALGTQATLIGGAGEAMMSPGRVPLTYYHRTGPVGAMFNAWNARNREKTKPNTAVGCIGMGTASLTAYGAPKQKMTIFEIDTHVRRLVEPPLYFNFVDLAKKQGVDIDFVMGDARISLERQDRKFGFILVDAFSSDAIPAHLLTKQAMELFFQRLEDDGLLAVHISNRYLDLEPVVERLCRELKLSCRVMHGTSGEKSGKFAATWIAIAKTKEALGSIEEDAEKWEEEVRGGQVTYNNRWLPLTRKDEVGLWTDDYSPIIPILRGEWRFWSRSDD